MVVTLVSLLLFGAAVLARWGEWGGALDRKLGIGVGRDRGRGLVVFFGWGGSLDGRMYS